MKPAQSTANRAAFTFGELMVVLTIVLSVAVLVLQASRTRRGCVYRMSCVNNLKQTSLAFKQWALDNDDKFPTHVSMTNGGAMELVRRGDVYVAFLVMSNELNTPKVLFCPEESNRRRKAATSWGNTPSNYAGAIQIPFVNNSNTSYFVGVDAEDAKPQMLFVGDACFSIAKKPVAPGLHNLWPGTEVGWTKPIRDHHGKGGHIGLTDGSVTACDAKMFQRTLRQSGDPNNRLAIP